MSRDSELKTEPGPLVDVRFEDGSSSVTCPAPVLQRQTPPLCPCLSDYSPLVQPVPKEMGKTCEAASLGVSAMGKGYRSMSIVRICLWVRGLKWKCLWFVSLLRCAMFGFLTKAAMENLRVLGILRPWMMILLCVTRIPSQPSKGSSEWCSSEVSF